MTLLTLFVNVGEVLGVAEDDDTGTSLTDRYFVVGGKNAIVRRERLLGCLCRLALVAKLAVVGHGEGFTPVVTGAALLSGFEGRHP